MCGIIGCFSKEPIKDVDKIIKDMKVSIVKLQERGDDATGIGLINSKTGKINVLKDGIEATEFVKSSKFSKFIKEFGEFNILLAHTRAATSGTEKENKNNHPFYHSDKGSILIHNGVISSHDDLKDKYKLEPEGECDSELILSLFDKFNGNIKKTIARVDGSLAVALYHDKKLYLFKNTNPIYIITNDEVSDDKLFYFTSKPEYLNNLFTIEKSFYDIFKTTEINCNLVEREMENDELITFNCETGKFNLEEVESGKIEYAKPYCSKNYQSYHRAYDEQKKICGMQTMNETDTNTMTGVAEKIAMHPDKFNGFLRQIKTTCKRLSDDQKLKLFSEVSEISSNIWENFEKKYSDEWGGYYGC